MWFDDEDMSGGRLRSSRGGGTGIVRLRTRMTERKKINVYRIGSLVLIPAVAVVAVLVGWYLIKLGGMLVFTGNDRFAITSLRIDPQAVVVQDFVRGKKGINEGTNIFSFDLARLREDFQWCVQDHGLLPPLGRGAWHHRRAVLSPSFRGRVRVL